MASTTNILLFAAFLLAATAFSTGVSDGSPAQAPNGKAEALQAALRHLHDEGRLPKGLWRRMHRDKALKQALQTGAPLPSEYSEVLGELTGRPAPAAEAPSSTKMKELSKKMKGKGKEPEVAKVFPRTRGKKYCVPKPEVSDQVLQANIDWACTSGVDCDPLVNMKEISCADRSLRTKAGYAMNYYYNANGRNESTCDFNQTAMLTLENPSVGKCVFL